ncbi:MAG: hypothetical protein ACKO5F_04005, partial [Synechococcus sp.]
AFFALIAVGLAQLAVMMAPDSHAVQTFARRSSSLALLASLLFVVLIPLQVLATVKSEAVLLDPKFARIEYTRNQLERLRSQVAGASNVADLDAVLSLSQGFRLPPEAMGQSLEQVQATLLANIDAARQQLPNTKLERAAWRSNALQRSLRVCLTAFLTAIGFAALGRRRGSDTSAIDELSSMIAELRGGLDQMLTDRREEAEARRAFREEIRLNENLRWNREWQQALDQQLARALTDEGEDDAFNTTDSSASTTESHPARRRGKHALSMIHDEDYFHRIGPHEDKPINVPPDQPPS